MKKPIKKRNAIYFADYETTAEKWYNKHGETKVWLWSTTHWFKNNKPTKKCVDGRTMETFLGHLSGREHNTILFFHNLKWDGWYILDRIREHPLIVKDVKYLINERKVIYSMSIKFFNNKIINMQCSSLLLGYISIKQMGKMVNLDKLDEGFNYDRLDYTPTKKDYDYIHNDVLIMSHYFHYLYQQDISPIKGKIRLTASSYSFKYFKSKIPAFDLFWKDKIQVKTWDIIKKYTYFGGLTIFNHQLKDKIHKKCLYLDRNSMYPAEYGSRPMPYGEMSTKKPDEPHIVLYMINIIKWKIRDWRLPPHLHLKTHDNPIIRALNYGYNNDPQESCIICYLGNEWEEIKKSYQMEYINETYWRIICI